MHCIHDFFSLYTVGNIDNMQHLDNFYYGFCVRLEIFENERNRDGVVGIWYFADMLRELIRAIPKEVREEWAHYGEGEWDYQGMVSRCEEVALERWRAMLDDGKEGLDLGEINQAVNWLRDRAIEEDLQFEDL